MVDDFRSLVAVLLALIISSTTTTTTTALYADKRESRPTRKFIEDCPEVTVAAAADKTGGQRTSTFECHNPSALISTLCEAIAPAGDGEAAAIVESTCPTAKMVASFFERMEGIDLITNVESTDDCYDDNDPVVARATAIKMVDFVLDVIDAYEFKMVIIMLDSSTAMMAKQLQRRLNSRPLKAVIANLDYPHFDLVDSLGVWSNSHNFLVFCDRDNQMRTIKAADKLRLFGEPYLWIFEEGRGKNATEFFAEFNVEYVWNVNVARLLNDALTTGFWKRPTVTMLDTSNVRREMLDEYRRGCITGDFSRWTRTNDDVRSGRSPLPIIVNRNFDGDGDTAVLGYRLFRMARKCFGPIELKSIGVWTAEWRFFEIESRLSLRSTSLSLHGCHFKVGIVDNPPCVMLKDGDDPYAATGMDVELLNTLADKSGFTYEFFETNESSLGNWMDDEWTGLIKLLQDRRIDMILPSMAVTSKRCQAMDFSATVRDVNAVVLIKKQGPEDDIFSDYVQPFERKVWLALCLVFLASVVGLAFTRLFGPSVDDDDDDNPAAHSRRPRRRRLHRLRWWNSFYTLYRIMLQQGVDRTPNSNSGRIVFASFLIGIMILMQNYASVLVSFLTVNKPIVPFSTLQGLTESKDYRIGLVEGSSLVEVFSTSNEPIRKRLWAKISGEPAAETMWPNLDVALDKVINEKVALLIRSNAVHDLLLTNCSFNAALKNIVKVSYHVAVRKQFPYTGIISQHITRLRETGFLDRLRSKYSLPGRNTCTTGDQLSAITLGHVTFLLYILAVGFALTLLFFVAERLLHLFGRNYEEAGDRAPSTTSQRRIRSKPIKVELSPPTNICRYVIKVERGN